MIYKYTEWVLFKDGQVSVKEKRVCVRPFGVTKKAIRVYWRDGWFYAPRCYLNTGIFEINVSAFHLHKRDLESISEVDSAFASLEVIK